MKNLRKLKCAYCGKVLSEKQKRQECCSLSCSSRLAASRAGKRINDKNYKCKKCGKFFHPKESNRVVYCSRECSFADAKNWPWMQKTGRFKAPMKCRIWFHDCKVCGEHLPTNYHGHLCENHRPGRKREECLYCGQALSGVKSKFCSHLCRRKYQKDSDPQYWEWLFWGNRKGVCLVCGDEFVKQFEHHIYCGKSCANKGRNFLRGNFMPSAQDAKRLGLEDTYEQLFLLKKEINHDYQRKAGNR